MTSYEAEYIKGAYDERKRIYKELQSLILIKNTSTIELEDILDIIQGKERK